MSLQETYDNYIIKKSLKTFDYIMTKLENSLLLDEMEQEIYEEKVWELLTTVSKYGDDNQKRKMNTFINDRDDI